MSRADKVTLPFLTEKGTLPFCVAGGSIEKREKETLLFCVAGGDILLGLDSHDPALLVSLTILPNAAMGAGQGR